jgi:MFS family permease
VGNSRFGAGSGIADLKFPRLDVEELAVILSDPKIGSFQRVEVLIEKTKDEILSSVANVLDDERGATIFFYYSGHGKVSDSGRLYLAASNTTERHLPANGVRFDSIIEMKDDFGCGRFCAVLDCCYAGLASDAMKGSKEDQLKSLVQGKGVFFLGAANSTTAAREEEHLGHGVLTAAIIDGLSTGKADIGNRGRITGSDLFAWCRDFAVSHNAVRPIQVNKVEGDELVIAFSSRRITTETIQRVHSALTLCWEHRMLSLPELEQLRTYFARRDNVAVPAAGSLEHDFLEYADGKIRFDELLGRRRVERHQITGNTIEGATQAAPFGSSEPAVASPLKPSLQPARRKEQELISQGDNATATLVADTTLSESERRAQLRKVVIASTIGNAIEWYDFFLYNTAAGLVFGKLYFPSVDPLTATVAAFGTYFVGFATRPIGAAIFGHYGDRIGRKPTLIATLLFTGIATFLVAFVPTYASIGIWGAVILTVLRMIQGIGVGGEWGGSVLLAMEWARTPSHRGLVASWPQFAAPCGLLLSNIAVLAFSQLSGDQFAVWGWRIPFGLSIILVGVGLWMRVGILETPVFQHVMKTRRIEKAPIVEVFRKHRKEVILSALIRVSQQVSFYIFISYILVYATTTLHLPRDLILTAVLVALCVSFITIPLSGHISDRIGRRKTYLIGAAAVGVFGFLYFGMVDTAIPGLVFIAIVLSLIPHDIQYGPQAALIAEAFTPRLRYSGASLGFQFASLIAGSWAPLIATALYAAYNSSFAIAAYIAVCAVISLVATALMPDYTGQDISTEYDD